MVADLLAEHGFETTPASPPRASVPARSGRPPSTCPPTSPCSDRDRLVIPVFDSFDYFADLLALLVVVVPAVLLVRANPVRLTVLIVAGSYLLFLIAPRLALFHLVMWIVVAALQTVVAATGERGVGLPILWGALAITLAPMVAWKVWPIDFVIQFNLLSNRIVERSVAMARSGRLQRRGDRTDRPVVRRLPRRRPADQEQPRTGRAAARRARAGLRPVPAAAGGRPDRLVRRDRRRPSTTACRSTSSAW